MWINKEEYCNLKEQLLYLLRHDAEYKEKIKNLEEEIDYLLEPQNKNSLDNKKVFCDNCRYYSRGAGRYRCVSPLNKFYKEDHESGYVGALTPWELNDTNNCKLFRKRYYNE